MGKNIDEKMNKNPENSRFQVLPGGLVTNPEDLCGTFVKAQATNTRLMGVMGLDITRETPDGEMHQLFYLDAEEYGLDEYYNVPDTEDQPALIKRSEIFGGLGGDWADLSEREAVALLKDFAAVNLANDLTFPEGFSEYEALLTADVRLSPEEVLALLDKICVHPINDEELINYFLMRYAGKDSIARSYLAPRARGLDSLDISGPATLYSNDITPEGAEGKTRIYRCQSIIEDDASFHKIISHVAMEDGHIAGFSLISRLDISPWEAAIILRQPEYVMYYHCDVDRGLFREMMYTMFHTMSEHQHEAGTLYMIFKQNNDHTRRASYRLDQDTLCVVCLMDSGDLLMASSDPVNLAGVETSVVAAVSIMNCPAKELGSYKFPEPIIGSFLESGCYGFEKFLKFIKNPEE